jgi:hypothetical protein
LIERSSVYCIRTLPPCQPEGQLSRRQGLAIKRGWLVAHDHWWAWAGAAGELVNDVTGFMATSVALRGGRNQVVAASLGGPSTR